MNAPRSGLAQWSPEQIEQQERWVAAWRRTEPDLSLHGSGRTAARIQQVTEQWTGDSRFLAGQQVR